MKKILILAIAALLSLAAPNAFAATVLPNGVIDTAHLPLPYPAQILSNDLVVITRGGVTYNGIYPVVVDCPSAGGSQALNYSSFSNAYTCTNLTTGGGPFLIRANNLSDLVSVGAARTNLGLGSMALQNSTGVAITGGTITGITPLTGAVGGTGTNNGSNAIAISGNLSTVGGFNLIATLTGNTNVTFPTSGTLATVGGAVSLTSAHLYVGNASNVATDTAITGDWSISNTGVVVNNAVNGVAYSSGPSTNTVPVITGSNVATYETVPNAALANSTITIGSTSISLGATSTTLAGLSSVTSTTFVGALTGNSSTATALQNARTIGAVSFNGTANIVPQTIQTVDDTTDTTTFVLLGNASGSQTGGQQPKTNSALGFNAATGALSATSFVGSLAVGNITGLGTGVATALGVNIGTAGAFVVNGGALGTPSSGVATNLTGTATALNIGGNAATATALQTPRAISIGGTTGLTATGVNFDGTGAISLTLTGIAVVANGGTGVATLASNGVLYGNGTGVVQVTAQGAANTVLTANAGAPSFSAAPTIGTSVTTPLVIGGTGTTSPLTLRSTSGTGTTGADVIIQTGTNGGTENARFPNGGGLGIGTTTVPAGMTLDVANGSSRFLSPNSGTTGGVIVRDAATSPGAAIIQFVNNTNVSQYGDIQAGSSSVALSNANYIVNGSTAYFTPINDGSNTAVFQIIGTTGSSAAQSISRYNTTTLGPGLSFIKSNSATVGTNTAVTSNQILGNLFFDGADGTTYPMGATLSAVVSGTVSTGVIPTTILMKSANASTGALETVLSIAPGAAGVVAMPGVNSNTTVTAANVNVDASGNIKKFGSSKRYKQDWQPLTDAECDEVLNMNPISYRSKLDGDDQVSRHLGFLAEEMDLIDQKLTTYIPSLDPALAATGIKIPDGVQYEIITSPLVCQIKKQKAKIDADDATITNLTNELTSLTARVQNLESQPH